MNQIGKLGAACKGNSSVTLNNLCLMSKSVFRTYMRKGVYQSWQCHQCKQFRMICLQQGIVNSRLYSPAQYGSVQREYKAFSSLLKRSGFQNCSDLHRLFSLGGVRYFSRTSSCQEQEQDKDKKNDDDKDKGSNAFRVSLLFSLLAWLVLGLVLWRSPSIDTLNKEMRYISWNEFYHDMLAKGEVDSVKIIPEQEVAIVSVHRGAVVRGKKVDVPFYLLKIPDVYHFEDKVRKAEQELNIKSENGISISYRRDSKLAQNLVIAAFVFLLMYPFFRQATKGQMMNPMDMFTSLRKAKFTRVDVMSQKGKEITFKDVAGLNEAKIEVMEFVDYMIAPQRFKELGAKIPRGALLLGPPGCGKTLLAKAVAAEAKVPFLAMAGSEFVEMIGGLGAARVRDLFKEARKSAPCIIYIDEIDAIGRKRSGSGQGGSGEEEQTLNQLLVEMDGMGTMEGVIVLASTNRADILDKALLRPGRFDRHIMIDLPTMIERKETFEMYLKKLTLSQKASHYSTRLAQMSPGMSGADIANICNEAAIHAARESKKAVDASDFDYAVERVVAGVAKKSHLLSPTEKKVVAYHESGHALVGWLLKYTDALLRISIVPRTNSALGFAHYMPSDQKLYSTEELFERMCMALGGRAAEAIIFNHVTTGAHDDLQKVTRMAFEQIRSYGMNEKIGHISFPSESMDSLGEKPYSKRLAAVIDEEARSLVNRAYRHTEEILKQNKDKLHTLATTLLQAEVLTYEEIEKLIGPPPFGKKNTIEPHGWEGIMPETNNDNGEEKRRKRKRSVDKAN